MPKRRCSFNPKLKTQFPNLRDADEIGKVLCTECKSIFSIEHGGISDIKQHLQKRKHLLAVSSSSSSKRIAAEEGMFAFHTIMHNHSFRSMDCTSSLIKKIHDKKFSCARTKCESIISKVIVPFAMEQVLEELKNIKFATLMVDTSNHKNLKLVPILIRYFDEDKLFDEYNHVAHVIQVKIIEWKHCSKKVTEKWCDVFKILEKNQISFNNFSAIIEYSLAIPGTNASVERIFSLTNVLWTDEKNRFNVETIKSIIIAKQHFKNITCSQFYEFLLKHPKLFNSISSSEKYEN
ncbi:uncharacterized protein LOC132927347 [Rhopalosiphum padi]|uniref:uncharacterized protein LOC132927347 n=1 Tax=Rhopalosiphum padi TaxID=40932 RepID=UPI00298DE465|nr:uncharacterized protein LOC132927347 [Rhopalosiphum padi]